MKIKVSKLRKQIVDILSQENYTKEQAEKMAAVYVFAEVTGKNTQGILKLMGTEPAQGIKPDYPPKIIKETSVSVLLDGGKASGPLAAQEAVDLMIPKAKKHGFAVAGTNNTFSSTGAISYYAYKLAKNDLIGIVGAGSPRSASYYGGIEPVFGTNPIAFGFPTSKYPVVFDMATSAITYYGLVRAKALGQQIPDNVALDSEGNPTTDPEKAMTGAILPFDRSYKGSGLALMVELLTGPLTGAQYVFDDGDWGTFFVAFKPGLLVDTDVFKENAADLVSKVKAAKAQPNSKIHIPGYDTLSKAEKILEEDGEIQIEDELLWKLDEISC